MKLVIDLEKQIYGPESLNISETYLGLAITEQKCGNGTKAIEMYKKSKKIKKEYLKQNPNDIKESVTLANIHYFIGKALSETSDDKDEIKKQYSKALAKFPK